MRDDRELKLIFTQNRKTGRIDIFRGKNKIAYLTFYIDVTQVNVTDVFVNRYYRGRGYGTMLLSTIMGFAKAKKKPIYLYSTLIATGFYEKMGFILLRKFRKGKHKGKRIHFMNLNPKRSFNDQVSDTDYIWFPDNIDAAIIYL